MSTERNMMLLNSISHMFIFYCSVAFRQLIINYYDDDDDDDDDDDELCLWRFTNTFMI